MDLMDYTYKILFWSPHHHVSYPSTRYDKALGQLAAVFECQTRHATDIIVVWLCVLEDTGKYEVYETSCENNDKAINELFPFSTNEAPCKKYSDNVSRENYIDMLWDEIKFRVGLLEKQQGY